MKKFILYFFFFLPLLLGAQSTKSKQKAQPPKTSVEEFFSAHQLEPDSACSPYLYYQIYDWAGTRYKYAGNSKKGIDCSGFVREMYLQAYCVALLGGSRDIWPTVSPVERNELREGDIVFFKIKKGQISHVGVYLGNNKFAHASVKYGVTISDLDHEFYKKHFFKGGRVNSLIY